MYPAILVALSFLVLMVSIHHYAAADKKIFSHIGTSFAVIAAAVLIVDYFVQISVIQPGIENGENVALLI